MKKLTASLVGVVMGGGILIEPVHADIASKAYVDDQIKTTTTSLDGKQDTANLVQQAGYSASNDDDKYPSVKAVKSAISTETESIKGDLKTVEQSLEEHEGKIITSEQYGQEMEYDETYYPSVQAVKDAITDATSDMATNTNLNQKQDKSNLVNNTDFPSAEEGADEKYPSVLAVKSAITTATQDLAKSSEVDAVESSVSDLGGRVDGVVSGLDQKIPKPSSNTCSNQQNKCVLTYNGSAYEWEPIERASGENAVAE